jgi:hypothetical protein
MWEHGEAEGNDEVVAAFEPLYLDLCRLRKVLAPGTAGIPPDLDDIRRKADALLLAGEQRRGGARVSTAAVVDDLLGRWILPGARELVVAFLRWREAERGGRRDAATLLTEALDVCRNRGFVL